MFYRKVYYFLPKTIVLFTQNGGTIQSKRRSVLLKTEVGFTKNLYMFLEKAHFVSF